MQQTSLSRILILAIGLSFAYSLPAIADAESDTSVIGSWVGEIEMGEDVNRLVFNISTGDNGTLTGTVDSPDKGIKGIPLSNVKVGKDSVLFEISAAQARFNGRFSKGKDSIEGTWNEGGTSFPTVLVRTNELDESTKSPGAHNIPKFMTVQRSTRHFDFYSSESDSKVLDNVAKTLDKNFDRITEHLQTQFTKKIRVLVYPDIESFHVGIYLPGAPDWVVGAAAVNELKMVSPLNPGKVHTYESLMQAIVHELVHAAVLNVREQKGLLGLPKWLNEGYAFYEADQINEEMRKAVKLTSQKNASPSWVQLDRASTAEFGEMNGYAYSATIIEFLVGKYGFEKLVKFIKQPEDIESIYGTTKEDLEGLWLEYIKGSEEIRKSN